MAKSIAEPLRVHIGFYFIMLLITTTPESIEMCLNAGASVTMSHVIVSFARHATSSLYMHREQRDPGNLHEISFFSIHENSLALWLLFNSL